MISALTLVILVAMGVGGYIAHPKAVASSEASIRPVYPGTASPTPKPTPTTPVEPTATPTPTPTKTATPSKPSFKTPPPSFGTFSLTNQLSVRQGQLWRALYTDDSGGQVWVATEVGTRLQEKVDAMRDVAVYEGGFACGVVQNRLCVGRLTNGVVTVAAFDSSNDALASVMATLLAAVK